MFPDHLIPKSLPAAAKKIFEKVANDCIAKQMTGAEEIAWGAVEAAGFSKDGHKWSLSKDMADVERLSKDVSPFQVGMALSKAEDRNGEWHLMLKASGLKRDKQNERMEPSALAKMVKLFNGGTVGMRESHKTTFSMAKSAGAVISDDGILLVDMHLDKAHPYSKFAFEKAQAGDLKEQVSVYGSVLKKDYVWDASAKTMVKSIQDVNVNYLDFTPPGEGAYPDAGLVEAISKQMSWEDPPPAPIEGAEKAPESVEKQTPPEGPQGGVSMEELIKQLEAIGSGMEGALEKAFPIKANMLQKSGGLKQEFVELRNTALKGLLTEEQSGRLSKAIESILNCAGIDTVEAEVTTLEKSTQLDVTKITEEMKKSLAAEVDKLSKQLDKAKGAGAETSVLEKSVADLSKQVEALKAQPAGGRPLIPTGQVKMEKSVEELAQGTPLEKSQAIMKQVEGLVAMRKSGQLGATEERMIRTQAVPSVLKALIQNQRESVSAQG